MKKSIFIAAFALLAAGSAFADNGVNPQVVAPTKALAVTFNSADGTGFVGKGDVQLPFGWNNAQIQANASGVTFTYSSGDSFSAVCTFTTGEGTPGEQVHNVRRTVNGDVSSVVTYESRKNSQGQVTGFNLTGYSNLVVGGDAIPEVGDSCPGGGPEGGIITSVTANGTTGGLYANYGGVSHLIYSAL